MRSIAVSLSGNFKKVSIPSLNDICNPQILATCRLRWSPWPIKQQLALGNTRYATLAELILSARQRPPLVDDGSPIVLRSPLLCSADPECQDPNCCAVFHG